MTPPTWSVQPHGNGSVTFHVATSTPDLVGSSVLRFTMPKRLGGPDSRGVPGRRCSECRRAWPVHAYLKRVDIIWGLGVWGDAPECPECEPPEAVPLVLDSAGHLKMRVDLHDATGLPLEVWDKSTDRWIRASDLGLRRMATSGEARNKLTFQPYSLRHGETVGPVADQPSLL